MRKINNKFCMPRSNKNIISFLSFCLMLIGCLSSYKTSKLICDVNNCFTVEQISPFEDKGNSGIYFIYGEDKKKNNFIHLRYADAPFYYRWKGDTLILRCPYWKVVSNRVIDYRLVDFSDEFTLEEKQRYGYDKGTQQFYINVSKDFKKINSYQLK